MKIISLIENTCSNPSLSSEHGLSLYVETQRHHLLFDIGASSKVIENAVKMNIDLKQIDTVILSHGHYDHTGGIDAFLEINNHADIYIQKSAFQDFYHVTREDTHHIGIRTHFASYPYLHLLEGNCKIDDELFLFSDIPGERMIPYGDQQLKIRKEDGSYIQDPFVHEQCLCINQEVLISGCSHHGILNILDTFHSHFDHDPSFVIAGLHTKANHTEEYSEAYISFLKELASELQKYDTAYEVCHCTGIKAYEILRAVMKEKIHYFSTGDTITINSDEVKAKK